MVHQRRAELTAAQKRYQRTEARSRATPCRASSWTMTGRHAERPGRAGRLALASAVRRGRHRRGEIPVIEAQSALEAAQANVARLQADISDSELKTDRVARVQYRVAQPGEVLPAGGKLLNLVDPPTSI